MTETWPESIPVTSARDFTAGTDEEIYHADIVLDMRGRKPAADGRRRALVRAAVAPFELEYNDRGDTFTTSCFQLLQWKHALKLEKLGMTMSRGKKVSTHMKRLMGLKRNTPIDYLIEWTEGALAHSEKAMGIKPE